jgi:hypothetical protein
MSPHCYDDRALFPRLSHHTPSCYKSRNEAESPAGHALETLRDNLPGIRARGEKESHLTLARRL